MHLRVVGVPIPVEHICVSMGGLCVDHGAHLRQLKDLSRAPPDAQHRFVENVVLGFGVSQHSDATKMARRQDGELASQPHVCAR